MKGMDRVKRGKGFRGLLNYLFKNSESRKIGGNMLAEDPRNLSREFAVTRRARPEVEKPVWHNALRLPKGEKISDEKWLEIIDEYMQLMGFDEDHMRTYVMHDEADGQHVHIIASRISPSSRLYTGENENLKSTQIIGELERKYGLIQTPQRKEGYNSARKDRSLPSRREAAAAAKDGDVSNRAYLQTALSDVMQNKPDVIDFIIDLRARGITAKPNVAKTGRMNGFSFEYNNVAFKASSLGRAYGWPRLQEHIHFDAEAHVDPLRSYANDLNIDVLKREKDNDRIRAEITASQTRAFEIREQLEQQQRELERVRQDQERDAKRLQAARATATAIATRVTADRAAATELAARASAVKRAYKELVRSAQSAYKRFSESLSNLLVQTKKRAPKASKNSVVDAFAKLVKQKQAVQPQQINLVALLDEYIKQQANSIDFNYYDNDTPNFLRDLIDSNGLEQPDDQDLMSLIEQDIKTLDELVSQAEESINIESSKQFKPPNY